MASGCPTLAEHHLLPSTLRQHISILCGLESFLTYHKVHTIGLELNISILSKKMKPLQYSVFLGCLGGSAVECLPLAQDMILGPGIESLIGLPAWSLLLSLPMSLSLSVCVSLMNK